MITVHHLVTSRSQRILWLLEELGVPYELKVYQRDPRTRLAPAELRQIHPLGKAPVITDGQEVIAESGAIVEYLGERFGPQAQGDMAHLVPLPGTPEHRQVRFWMHYAEGSVMNWAVMKLVFMTIPTQPMPFFVRPIARALCEKVQKQLIDRNLEDAARFMNDHLSKNTWFAGDHLTLADFQMSFAVEALLARGGDASRYPHLSAYRQRMNARQGYQQAIAKGGPVLMGK